MLLHKILKQESAVVIIGVAVAVATSIASYSVKDSKDLYLSHSKASRLNAYVTILMVLF